MNAIAQLVVCATRQAGGAGIVIELEVCTGCGGEAPAPFRNGPAICATCRVRAEVTA